MSPSQQKYGPIDSDDDANESDEEHWNEILADRYMP